MEPQAALVGTDCGVELNTETTVNLNLTLIVNPGNTEGDHTLGLNHALDNACFFESGVLLNNRLERGENLHNSLKEFGLACVTLLAVGVNLFEIFVFQHKYFPPKKVKFTKTQK
jgi:hypothetical protein